MKMNPYLMFDGKTKEAFTFYAKCLNGKIEAMLPFGEAPGCEDMPADTRDKIMHACLRVGDQMLMASDTTPQYPHEGYKGCSVALHVDSTAEAERIFKGLTEGGTVQMPLQETFWAERFGMLVDRFGVPWMVNCAKPKTATAAA